MSSPSSTPSHSLISIKKASSSSTGKSKRVVLPKADLIQFYIENSDQSRSPTSGSPSTNQGNKCRVLPKFNNQDVIKHLNFNKTTTTASVASLAPSLSTIAKTLTMVSSSEPEVRAFETKNVAITQSPGANTSPCRSATAKQMTAQNKKCEKEKKFKEITRLCLNHSTHTAHHIHSQSAGAGLDQEYLASNSAGSLASSASGNQTSGGGTDSCLQTQSSEIRQLVKHLAKEFLVDCRQRLDNDSFTKVLTILCAVKKESFSFNDANEPARNPMEVDGELPGSLNEEEAILVEIYRLIRNDKNLLNKFSAFLTCEKALYFDLFAQTCQYEKCYDFFHKLELFVPNKLTFKKLMQSVITTCNSANEIDTTMSKIDEIKTRLKSVAKNNALINFELDYLFDQRWTNLEPTYEKISLTNFDPSSEEPSQPVSAGLLSSQTSVNSVSNASAAAGLPGNNLLESFPINERNRKIYEKYLDDEFIDLTGEYPSNYGTKKCSCSCHSNVTSSPSQQAASSSAPANTSDLADEKTAPSTTTTPALTTQTSNGPTNHCLVCSLKFLKGKLCIKCEGKKAIPLVYRIRD